MVKHVLENANPDFPKNVQKGDIIVAGRNFGCSSGRAIAPKAIKATGVGAVIAEFFSRTFYSQWSGDRTARCWKHQDCTIWSKPAIAFG